MVVNSKDLGDGSEAKSRSHHLPAAVLGKIT